MKDRILQNKLAQSLSQFYDHIAVQYNNRFLSYGELDKRSNHTAQWIIKKGIEKETFIGVLINDKIKLIVTMIGILKAGCVFIPLDTAFPADRLKVMIESTDTKFIITDIVGFNDFLAGGNPGTIEVQNQDVEFCLVDDIFTGRESSWYIDRPAVQYSPDDKIYVYFTSGTTGTPKAIMGRNKGLLHFINWEIDTFAVNETFRFSQFTNPGFDAFLRDILVPLCSGGVICIPPDRNILLDSTDLIDWVDGTGINLIHCVPSLFRLFNSNPGSLTNHHFKHLKFILLSGEPIRPTDLADWYETFDERIRLVNLWGTSETTLAKTCYFIRKSDSQKERIPVGKPIRGAMVIVLNENMKICKPMVVGDIYIRTPYRTHGYYNDPALNKARFIPNPFGSDPGDLLHKTGDRGRLLPDDNLEFLGRSDRQVKIRGIRIELEEIESTLLTHPSVKEAVVVKREFSNHNELLCAYINAKDRVNGIKEYISGKLPDYMVPAHITKLEEIPRTPAGKVDFALLPDPLEKEVDYIPPGDVIERKLQELWSEILGLEKEKIGVNHNFLLLGGNSLNIMSLISKIHKELDTRIPLGDIFYHLTIEKQAKIIKSSKEDKYASISPVEEKEYYALSSAQKRMYILYRMEAGSSVYNVPSTMVLEGDIHEERLEETFIKLIKRHESFRTSFEMVGDKPVQRIHRGVPFGIDCFKAGQEEARQIIEGYLGPFDLSQAPILRVGLIKIGEARHILMVEMHHIISDGVSMVLMEKDFMALYRGEQLPSLRVRYRDFSEWRNNPAEREALVHQEAFWLKEFKGNIPALSLPTDYPRPLVQRFEGTRENFVMEAQQWEQLKNLVLKQGVTLYMVLLTIFNVLLAKLSSQEDIVVGTGVEGRRHEDLRQIIGMFVNTLPLRNYPQKEKTFIEFLGEVKERTLVAFENQDYQFEDLVEKVAPDRDTGRNPLFDICFQVENIQASVPATASPGIRAVPHGYKVKISRFDLTLRAGEIKGSLAFSIEYNTSLFKKETIKRFSMYFTRLIASVVSAPGKKLVEIEMIPNNEKEELLFQLNEALDNEVKIIHNKQYNTIQGKLNAALHLCIDHIAIAYGDRYLTYSELDKQSDYIANWMINKGIKCQTYIGLWVDNRMALITTMIGVLKAGCVFTPLDIDQPESKLEMMCRSVNVKYVISDNAAVSQMWEKGFIETHGPEFILWEELFVPTADSDEKPLWYKDTNRPAIQYRGEDQIYIYFTSGTTGTPRAMVGNNRSLLHFIDWEIETLGIKQDYRVSQLTTPGFDAFLRDVLVPLCSGGIICIPKSKDILLDPGALIDWVRKSGIHLIHCVPSVFRLFNSYRLTADDFIELKFILLSGEPIAIPDLVPWYDTFDERIQLVNLWGTSETTLAKTCYFIKKADIHRERIPVGLPIKGARTVILDKGMNICPPLVIGEIYIITPFSTYGYCNDPGLNNEKFLPNPFGTSHKYRMHKTGDLGRLLPDGNLDVLGRIDRQIKVRGIRVELEEIESLLMRHARIKDAVVIKKETDNPNELFYAYVVDSPGPESENEAKVELLGELEVYLAGKLPAYMLPASIIKIERVPRTSRGKVDYDSLPDPLAHKKPGYVAPRDTVEIKLSEIWSEILGIKKPGITSQFFKLGGNSLNIMSLISKIHKEFDVRIPLGDIFNHPTIQKQAEIIKRSTKEKFNPIDASEEKEYYPLSSSQKRMYVVQQLETESKSYNIPTIMVIEGEMDSRRLDRTFRELIKRHDSLRTSFITVEDEPVQKIHPEVTFNVDFYETEYEESQKIVENFIRPFDLTRASLLRAGVIKTDENRYILMVDMYHIISDAVSYEVLVKEFKIFYNGLEPSPLRLQYKDFSGWQDKLFTGGEIKKQEEYWLNRFSGDIPVLDLPTDYPRPAVRNNSAGDLIRFTLDKKLNDSLNRMVNEEETTLYMFLSAVFNILLSKYSKQEDIVVGTPITGRSHADLQDIIGVFLNMLAIRNRPTGNKSFREFLMEVKENALNAFKYSDFPFEELVFKLGVQGDPGRNPLFDAEFAVHSLNISQGSIKGLRVRPYRNENKFAKFDLHFLAVGANNYTTLTIRYSTELYKSSTIEMMKQDYLKILEQVLENPGIRLKDISIGQELLTGKSKISSEAEIGDFVF